MKICFCQTWKLCKTLALLSLLVVICVKRLYQQLNLRCAHTSSIDFNDEAIIRANRFNNIILFQTSLIHRSVWIQKVKIHFKLYHLPIWPDLNHSSDKPDWVNLFSSFIKWHFFFHFYHLFVSLIVFPSDGLDMLHFGMNNYLPYIIILMDNITHNW
jgi:hypothetical protein